MKLRTPFLSIEKLTINGELPDLVVLTGINGSGKTHLLQGISKGAIVLDDIAKSDCRYLNSESLSPLSSRHTEEAGWASFKNSRQQTWATNKPYFPGYNSLEELLESSVHRPELQRMEEVLISKLRANLDLSKVDSAVFSGCLSWGQDEFSQHFPFGLKAKQSSGEAVRDLFQNRLTQAFGAYRSAYVRNATIRALGETEDVGAALDESEFQAKYGRPPWLLLDELLRDWDLDFRTAKPTFLSQQSYQAKLVSSVNDKEIDFAQLSSGEKVLISLALCHYNVDCESEVSLVGGLLLLDEIDAHLHPKMTESLLKVITSLLIERLGCKVMMTTHSPSTIALAPPESIFVLHRSRDGHFIDRATKDEALHTLAEGMPLLSFEPTSRRQVFVESHHDEESFTALYQQFKGRLSASPSLTFIASGNTKSGGCSEVLALVEKMQKGGNKKVFGLLDWDKKNLPKGNRIKVLSQGRRYALENCLFDPVLIGALLLRDKLKEPSEFALDNSFRYFQLPNCQNEELQAIADHVVGLLREETKNDRRWAANFKSPDSKITCSYLNGRTVEVSKNFLAVNGHHLEEKLKSTFPGLNRYHKANQFSLEIITKLLDDIPDLLPTDLLEILTELQSSPP